MSTPAERTHHYSISVQLMLNSIMQSNSTKDYKCGNHSGVMISVTIYVSGYISGVFVPQTDNK